MEFSEQPPECQCSDTRVVKRVIASGSTRFERQCQRCGNSRAVAKASLTWRDKQEAGEYEKSLIENWQKKVSDFYERRRQECAAFQQQQNAAWWARYSEYLESDKWKLKSRKVIERDKTCQACLTREARQAHHLTYDHVFDEPLFDLVGVCVQCHDKITAMDRARRGVA